MGQKNWVGNRSHHFGLVYASVNAEFIPEALGLLPGLTQPADPCVGVMDFQGSKQ
jgi:hypothetical protein